MKSLRAHLSKTIYCKACMSKQSNTKPKKNTKIKIGNRKKQWVCDIVALPFTKKSILKGKEELQNFN